MSHKNTIGQRVRHIAPNTTQTTDSAKVASSIDTAAKKPTVSSNATHPVVGDVGIESSFGPQAPARASEPAETTKVGHANPWKALIAKVPKETKVQKVARWVRNVAVAMIPGSLPASLVLWAMGSNPALALVLLGAGAVTAIAAHGFCSTPERLEFLNGGQDVL